MEGNRSTARRGSLVLEYHRGIGRATNPPGSGAARLKTPPDGCGGAACRCRRVSGRGLGKEVHGRKPPARARCAHGENPRPRGPAGRCGRRVGSGQVGERAVAPLPVRACGVAKISGFFSMLKKFRQWPSSARAAEAQCKGPVGSRLRQVKPRAQESLRITS